MDENSQPTNAELLAAIVSLHAFTESGLQRNDAKIDLLRSGMDRRFDRVYDVFDEMRSDVNARIAGVLQSFQSVYARFDRVDVNLDELKVRVARLEIHSA